MTKSVLDAGWGAFRTMLSYKCDDAGGWFEEVNEAYSAQTCSCCESRTGPRGVASLGIREWQCEVCGMVHDRDVNAARNILAVGRDALQGGVDVKAFAIAFLLVAGLFGLLNFIFSSRAPLNEYAHELHSQMPSLKGKLICDSNTLTFTGTQDVSFKWYKTSYQIAYPTSTVVSEIATSCGLGIKPEMPDVVTKLEGRSKEATEAVEAMLTSQVIPRNVTPKEKELLSRLLMTLNPVSPQKVTVLSTEGPSGTKLEIKEPQSKETTATAIQAKPDAPKHVVPKQKTPSKATEPLKLSNQDLQQNISTSLHNSTI